MSRFNSYIVASALLSLSGVAAAQAPGAPVADEIVEAKKREEAAEKLTEGWQSKMSLGANLAMSQTQNALDGTNGSTLQIGILADGQTTYRKGQHQVLTEGKLSFTQAKTPLVPVLAKTGDNLEIQSTYFYSTKKVKWLGPFARARAQTAVFPGYYVAKSGTIMEIDGGEGVEGGSTSTNPEVAYNDVGYVRYNLTDNFEPLMLKGVAGALAAPVDKGTKLKVTFHIGLGAENVRSKGGYSVVKFVNTDDDKTPENETLIPELQVKTIPSYSSVGAEFEASANGTINDYVSWTIAATLFQPVYNSIAPGFTTDNLNQDYSGKVSVKLSKWASMDIYGAAKKYPLISPDMQVQTGLLLSTTFNLL